MPIKWPENARIAFWVAPRFLVGPSAPLANAFDSAASSTPLFKPITEFVPDSPLEGTGFEPSVPRSRGDEKRREVRSARTSRPSFFEPC
jgi:hypothetical protein